MMIFLAKLKNNFNNCNLRLFIDNAERTLPTTCNETNGMTNLLFVYVVLSRSRVLFRLNGRSETFVIVITSAKGY